MILSFATFTISTTLSKASNFNFLDVNSYLNALSAILSAILSTCLSPRAEYTKYNNKVHFEVLIGDHSSLTFFAGLFFSVTFSVTLTMTVFLLVTLSVTKSVTFFI